MIFDVIFDVIGNCGLMESIFEKCDFGGMIVFVGFVDGVILFLDLIFYCCELMFKVIRNLVGVFFNIIWDLEEGWIDVGFWISYCFFFVFILMEFVILW